MSDLSIENFPPTSKIFEETKRETKKKKQRLSAISKAEIIGGFQPTTEDVIESSRAQNPFDMPSQRSTSKTSSIQNINYSPKRNQYFGNLQFNRKLENFYSYVHSETNRLMQQDANEFLCAKTKKELNAAQNYPMLSIRKRMFNLGLL